MGQKVTTNKADSNSFGVIELHAVNSRTAGSAEKLPQFRHSTYRKTVSLIYHKNLPILISKRHPVFLFKAYYKTSKHCYYVIKLKLKMYN